MLLISFTKYPNFLASKDVPFILTLSNYQQILAEADLHILDYFKNSVIIALVVTVLTVVVASLLRMLSQEYNSEVKALL